MQLEKRPNIVHINGIGCWEIFKRQYGSFHAQRRCDKCDAHLVLALLGRSVEMQPPSAVSTL